jgi:hypothetical protein
MRALSLQPATLASLASGTEVSEAFRRGKGPCLLGNKMQTGFFSSTLSPSEAVDRARTLIVRNETNGGHDYLTNAAGRPGCMTQIVAFEHLSSHLASYWTVQIALLPHRNRQNGTQVCRNGRWVICHPRGISNLSRPRWMGQHRRSKFFYDEGHHIWELHRCYVRDSRRHGGCSSLRHRELALHRHVVDGLRPWHHTMVPGFRHTGSPTSRALPGSAEATYGCELSQ